MSLRTTALIYYSFVSVMQTVFPFPPMRSQVKLCLSPVSIEESTLTGTARNFTESLRLARTGRGKGTRFSSSLQKSLSYFSFFSSPPSLLTLASRSFHGKDKYFPSCSAEKFSSSILVPNLHVQIHPMVSSEDS